MAALLGGPPPDPLAPAPVVAERLPQGEVVVGQVVLGEEVDLERGPRDLAQLDCRSAPRARRCSCVPPRTARTRAGTTPSPGRGVESRPFCSAGSSSVSMSTGDTAVSCVRRWSSMVPPVGSRTPWFGAIRGRDRRLESHVAEQRSGASPPVYVTGQGITVKASIDVWVPRAAGRASPSTTMRS